MAMKRHGNAVVTEIGIALGNHRRPVERQRAEHRIAQTRSPNAVEDHLRGTGQDCAATGGFVANSDNSFQLIHPLQT